MRVPRRASENSRKSHWLPAFSQQFALENKAFPIGKRAHFSQNHGRVMQQLRISARFHSWFFHLINQPRRVLQAASQRSQNVIHKYDLRLAFDYSSARSRAVIVNFGFAVFFLSRLRCALPCTQPRLQIVILVLQGVRQFVRENWRLTLEGNPVQHRNRFRLVIVVGSDLLAISLDHELPQIEFAGQKAELLHGHLGARKALRVSLLRLLVASVLLDFSRTDQTTLDRGALRKTAIL